MPNEHATRARTKHGNASGTVRETVFIIDDDPLMAELLERRLERRGFEPVRFDDPGRLLDEIADVAPAFLFTDLEMPLMRGADLAAKARTRGYRGMIVVATASREQADLVAAIGNGADEILVKPVKDGDLDLIIAKAEARARRDFPAMELLRAVLEPVDQGVVFLDEECVPFYANRRACEILDAAGVREVREVLERGNLAAHVMKEQGPHGGVVFVDVSKPGAAGARLLVGFETHEVAGVAPGRTYIVLMHDFSEWRKLDELHSRFATYLSHRMRTPLTSARNAVQILSGKDDSLDVAERERFLDIGCRNIEKLISSFNELQKVFMVESGEINAYRSLIRVSGELDAILGECEHNGLIKGFKLRAPDCTALTCRSRLKEYVMNGVEAMAGWLGELPYVDCTVTTSDGLEDGVDEPALFITLGPRRRTGETKASLKDYLALDEIRKGLVLERLARALDGSHVIAANDALRLRLPAQPSFDRERDLIHPLHMMLERSDLDRTAFHLVSMRLYGAVTDMRRFSRLLEANLCAIFGKDEWLVARQEGPERFALFATGASRSQIGEAMKSLRERFASCCRERGEELYPAIRWEITYCREPGACSDPLERAAFETLI
jgi:DNA-binding response OmpR family regulator